MATIPPMLLAKYSKKSTILLLLYHGFTQKTQWITGLRASSIPLLGIRESDRGICVILA